MTGSSTQGRPPIKFNQYVHDNNCMGWYTVSAWHVICRSLSFVGLCVMPSLVALAGLLSIQASHYIPGRWIHWNWGAPTRILVHKDWQWWAQPPRQAKENAESYGYSHLQCFGAYVSVRATQAPHSWLTWPWMWGLLRTGLGLIWRAPIWHSLLPPGHHYQQHQLVGNQFHPVHDVFDGHGFRNKTMWAVYSVAWVRLLAGQQIQTRLGEWIPYQPNRPIQKRCVGVPRDDWRGVLPSSSQPKLCDKQGFPTWALLLIQ